MAEISTGPLVCGHNGDPQPWQAGHNETTRRKRHQSTLSRGALSRSRDLILALRKATVLLKDTLKKSVARVSSELLLEPILSGANTLFSVDSLPSVAGFFSGKGSQAL